MKNHQICSNADECEVFLIYVFISLGPLVGKVKEYQVEMMVDTLCSNMVSDKEQLRDISSMGLKTVIAELPPPTAGKTFIVCLGLMKREL